MDTRTRSTPRLCLLVGALTLLGSAACAGAPYKRGEPPAGLVSVNSWKGHDRLKGGDDGGVNITSFENRDAAGLVRKHASVLRGQFAQAMGARIVDVAEMDLVLAHLHVPEAV